MSEQFYSVWLDGAEINDYYLTLDEANDLADFWRENLGYNNVVIRQEVGLD